ncbi:MAG: hypothetical protein E7641_08795 [Ruminococcaceae bacterium]|nr:hypothetical protein [Oscillospiraceae bacterium]
MMRTLYKYRYEISLLILICFFLPIALFDPKTSFMSALKLLLYICDIALVYLTLRKLYRLKWRKAIISVAQKIAAAVAKLFMRIREILPFPANPKNVISGETKIHFDFDEVNYKREKSKKQLKWKQLRTDRERLRYLYRYVVSERIKHGERIYASHTPSEIELISNNTESEAEVFTLYKNYRYDERKIPNEEQIQTLKNEHYSNLK